MDNFLLLHSGYSIVSRVSISAVILTSFFFNFADFGQLHISNAQSKYYEILTTNTKILRNTTRKSANWYMEFKYHLLTLHKKIPIIFNKGVSELQIGISKSGSPGTQLSVLPIKMKDWRTWLYINYVSLYAISFISQLFICDFIGLVVNLQLHVYINLAVFHTLVCCLLYIVNSACTHGKSEIISTHWGRVTHICVSDVSLVQIMACRLIGAKPLPEPVLE